MFDTSSDFQLSPSRMREFSFRSHEVVIIYCRLVNKELSLKAKARAKDHNFVLKDNQGPRPRATSQ